VEHYGQTEMPAAHPMINIHGVVGSCGYIPPRIRGQAGTECLIKYDIENNCPVRDAQGWMIKCGPNDNGESIVKLEGEYKGYTDQRAVDKVIYTDVFAKGDRWYHSGDMLRYNEEGFFFFVDRIGDTFRWKGENVSTGEVCEVVGRYKGVSECNIYGVQIPLCEGRAGMASILPNEHFKKSCFYRFVTEKLPSYAQPLFLRMRTEENDKTATFKFRKFQYQTEGFDPSKISDKLYFRDDRQRTYVEMTQSLYNVLITGSILL
jgi:fatty-acyl-CoA synthase